MSIAVVIFAAVAGLLIGSFLNVCIARLPAGESIVAPRSHCRGCGAAIRWYENVPIVSFLLLRGRCRECRASISSIYPAVEISTAVWFAACFAQTACHLDLPADDLMRSVVSSLALSALGALLIGLAVIDWQHHLLPDAMTLTGIVIGLFFACAQAIFLAPDEDNVVLRHAPNINSANAGRSPGNIFLTGPEHLIFGRLLAAAGAFLLLYLIRVSYRALRGRDGMGLGDAKLLAMIASFLGMAPTIVALFAGVFLATVFGVVLLLRGRATAATRLPFGSFLAAGGLFSALAAGHVIDRYLALFR